MDWRERQTLREVDTTQSASRRFREVVHRSEIGEADPVNRAELGLSAVLPERHRSADAKEFTMCRHACNLRNNS